MYIILCHYYSMGLVSSVEQHGIFSLKLPLVCFIFLSSKFIKREKFPCRKEKEMSRSKKEASESYRVWIIQGDHGSDVTSALQQDITN